jgi:type I restriction enzyme R subunit
MAQSVASRVGLYTSSDERQIDLLRRLQDHGIVPREIGGLFHEIRKAGNDANHNLAGDHRTALMAMRLAWQLGLWFHRTFKDPGFKSGPFIPPMPPVDESADLKAELEALQREVLAFRAAHQDATQALEATQVRVQQTEEERAFWEAMAAEAEIARNEMARRLEAIQAKASAQPPQAVARLVAAANTAAATVKLSEADTRKIIDEQLATAGWTVDSTRLTFAKGARPQRGQNLAIAEWWCWSWVVTIR